MPAPVYCKREMFEIWLVNVEPLIIEDELPVVYVVLTAFKNLTLLPPVTTGVGAVIITLIAIIYDADKLMMVAL
jgi:hypothetical protein